MCCLPLSVGNNVKAQDDTGWFLARIFLCIAKEWMICLSSSGDGPVVIGLETLTPLLKWHILMFRMPIEKATAALCWWRATDKEIQDVHL